jgi:hypothetical protein
MTPENANTRGQAAAGEAKQNTRGYASYQQFSGLNPNPRWIPYVDRPSIKVGGISHFVDPAKDPYTSVCRRVDLHTTGARLSTTDGHLGRLCRLCVSDDSEAQQRLESLKPPPTVKEWRVRWRRQGKQRNSKIYQRKHYALKLVAKLRDPDGADEYGDLDELSIQERSVPAWTATFEEVVR